MSEGRKLDVLVVGDLFIDLVMSGLASWPQVGEESVAKQFCREAGGGAAITACGLAKLGMKAGVLGAVGEEDGRWILERLEAHGVATSGIYLSPKEPTAFTVCVSGPSDRSYFTYMGANRELPGLLLDAVKSGQFSGARHVHLACAPDPSTLLIVFEALVKNGCSISADVGWQPEWLADKRSMAALRQADIFFPNEREAARMTGETQPQKMLEVFQRAGLKNVALKLGAGGAAVLSDGKIIFQKPGRIEPIDTTGAGDCFDTGFLYAWLRGDDPKMCLRVGAVCGELSTRALGGISGFPGREELESTICSVK